MQGSPLRPESLFLFFQKRESTMRDADNGSVVLTDPAIASVAKMCIRNAKSYRLIGLAVGCMQCAHLPLSHVLPKEKNQGDTQICRSHYLIYITAAYRLLYPASKKRERGKEVAALQRTKCVLRGRGRLVASKTHSAEG